MPPATLAPVVHAHTLLAAAGTGRASDRGLLPALWRGARRRLHATFSTLPEASLEAGIETRLCSLNGPDFRGLLDGGANLRRSAGYQPEHRLAPKRGLSRATGVTAASGPAHKASSALLDSLAIV